MKGGASEPEEPNEHDKDVPDDVVAGALVHALSRRLM